MRRKPIDAGKRCDVSAWFPSEPLRQAAAERTEGMVGYFLLCARRSNPLQWQDDLYTLARSCYLQGAADTAKVAAEQRRNEQVALEAKS
jgi:hypothetical protein